MALILLLESSAGICSVALSDGGTVIASRENRDGNKHAELLSVFCAEVLEEAKKSTAQLDAVAVSSGPGSYTGLRIGTSTAKGYCFALNIPLIAIPTLEAMARGMRSAAGSNDLLIPMIDARRMEVYSAVYTTAFEMTVAPAPVVLDEHAYRAQLDQHVTWFSGDGMPKAKELLSMHANARFTELGMPSANYMAEAAEERYQRQQFEDLAYFVPFYLKNFQPGPKRSAQ